MKTHEPAYRQVDWTAFTDHCPQCYNPLPQLRPVVGRPMVYCSDACKMRAYRLRSKPLRNPKAEPVAVTKLNRTKKAVTQFAAVMCK